MRKNYRGSVMCKAVMQSSPQRFPTPANRWENRRLSTLRHCRYNHAERLQMVDKDSPSGPKRTCNQCAHQSTKMHK